VVDGNIDAEEWGDVPEAAGFHILGKDELAFSRTTSFKMGWTPHAVWFAARCDEPAPGLIKTEAEDGGNVRRDDSMAVFLRPAGVASFLQFVVNAKGARWSGKGLENWQAETTLGQDGWRLEIMIPFALLGRTPVDGELWLLNLARNIPRSYFEPSTSWPGSRAGADECVSMRRSANGPNELIQTMERLSAGRLYSVSCYTYGSKYKLREPRHAVTVNVARADVLRPLSSQAVIRKLNLHFVVFRARGDSAVLTISDWKTPSEPGGEIGRELLYDFVEIQPYGGMP